MCEIRECGDDEKFMLEYVVDGLVCWVFRSRKYKYFLVGIGEGINCFVKRVLDEDLFFWYIFFVMYF